MAKCSNCKTSLGFLDKVTVYETVLRSPLFSSPPLRTFPSGGKACCADCVVREVVAVARKFGAGTCNSCKTEIEKCSIPIEAKYLGLWSPNGPGKLQFRCIKCSTNARQSSTPGPETRNPPMEDEDFRHPWQDYADDDPNFWENLRD